MTIAVIWQEDGRQWCAADTRLVVEPEDKPTIEIGSKIYVIPVSICALTPDGFLRQPHYWTQYGFVYAGAALPASMTAVTASTFLQGLARPGDRSDPPTFEQIAELVRRVAQRFMTERRRFGAESLFSAALFGWCPHQNKYRIAHINGRDDLGIFRVELSYPASPEADGDPWLVLGSAASNFRSALADYKGTEKHITKRVPRRVVEKMVSEGSDSAVGGSTSIGAAHQNGFELFFTCEPTVPGQPQARRILNGLDLDAEIGNVGQYIVAPNGIA